MLLKLKMLPCCLSHFKATLSSSSKQGCPSAVESASVPFPVPLTKIAKVKQKETFQQPFRCTYYKSQGARVPKTGDHKPLKSTLITSSHPADFHTPLCASLASRLAVQERHLIGLWAQLSQQVLEFTVKKRVWRVFFANFVRRLCKPCVLRTPHLPPLYSLNLFKGRDRAISFLSCIIPVIFWFPASSREAMCSICMLYMAVEIC